LCVFQVAEGADVVNGKCAVFLFALQRHNSARRITSLTRN